jgi:hypothetical protein
MSPVADNPIIVPEREQKARRIGTTAHPLPTMRLVAPQRRQMVLHLRT